MVIAGALSLGPLFGMPASAEGVPDNYASLVWQSDKMGTGLYGAMAADVDDDGMVEIITGNTEGFVKTFDGVTKQLEWTSAYLGSSVHSIAVDDLDGDGSTEVVTDSMVSLDEGYVHVLSGTTGMLEWKSGSLGGAIQTVLVADPDNDGVKEILAGQNHGYLFVINGVTHEIEWSIGDIGSHQIGMAVADVDDDGTPEILIQTNYVQILVLDGITKAEEWRTSDLGEYIFGIAVGDIDNDGTKEIVAGEYSEGYLWVIDGMTHSEKWIWRHGATVGNWQSVVLRDWDLDGGVEILVGTQDGYVYVFDGVTELEEWHSDDLGSNAYGLDVKDVNADGRDEILIGTYEGELFLFASPLPVCGWERRAPMLTGSAGIYSATATNEGKVYVIGGYNGSVGPYLSRLDVYNPATDTWTRLADLPYARGALEAVALNGKIYAIGGFAGGPINRVDIYDPVLNTWTPGPPNLFPRVDSAAAVLDGKIYVIGGARGGKFTTEVFDPNTNTWSWGPPLIRPRAFLTAQAVNGKIYAIGGIDVDASDTVWRTVEEYSPTSGPGWVEKAGMAVPRIAMPSALVGGRIFVFGGESIAGGRPRIIPLSSIEVYDPSANSWSFVSCALPVPTVAGGAASVDGMLFFFGGGPEMTPFSTNQRLLFPPRVSIDIKPGSYPNTINMKERGTVPVAILSTPLFDAPSSVKRDSLTFGHSGAERSLDFCSPGPKDVNSDGLLDLVCHFTVRKTGFVTGDIEGILRGQTLDGVKFEGRDSVRIIGG